MTQATSSTSQPSGKKLLDQYSDAIRLKHYAAEQKRPTSFCTRVDKDIKATMIYMHVLQRGGQAAACAPGA
jgi:hypothetical protein